MGFRSLLRVRSVRAFVQVEQSKKDYEIGVDVTQV